MHIPPTIELPGMIQEMLRNAEAHHAQGSLDKAAALYRSVLAEYPCLARTAYNLGIILNQQGLYPLAEEAFCQAIDTEPDFFEARLNRLFAIQEQGKINEALAGCRDLVAHHPVSPDARFNLACLQLLTGDLTAGWEGYEARFDTVSPAVRRHTDLPRWDGIARSGLRLLIHTEQGFGDTIQMARYVPILTGVGVHVLVETTAPLAGLLERIPGLHGCVPRGTPLPPIDCQLPVMSLPLTMHTTLDSIPATVPYVSVDTELVRAWHNLLPAGNAPRIGLAWAGRLDLPVNRKRSCPPELISTLLDIPGGTFASLQKTPDEPFLLTDPRLFDLTPHLRDFHDTAALIANLDLVITIDTAVAHLAGAMGKPTWLLLPHVPDWRWLLHRSDSPWYPTMRLFRQPRVGDWESVISQVRSELTELILQKAAPANSPPAEAIRNRDVLPAATGHNRLPPLEQRDTHTLFRLGYDLLREGNDRAAATAFRQALSLEPSLPEAWHNLGHACRDHAPDEAVHAFRMAVRLAPDNSDFSYSLAACYVARERFEEALICHRQTLQRDPADIRALTGAGFALQNLHRNEEAREYYVQALSLNPEDPFALNNLGVLLRESGQLEASRACFATILRRNPDDGDAHWNLSHSLLLDGDLASGWREHEWRFHRSNPVTLPALPQPRWRGESPAGRTILLYAEQAYGDTIQFIRFAGELARLGASVIVECQDASLRELLAASPGMTRVVVRGEPRPPFDWWSPLLSIPLHLGVTLETIPAPVPYLSPPAATAARWASRLHESDLPRVGLVWSGRSRPDPRRSCPASALLGLAPLRDRCRWYSLQVAAVPAQLDLLAAGLGMTDLAPELTDFSETAAAIMHLDLVITIDTAVAHLAGSLGKPVWLLLPFAPDWRWLLKRADSPWYPTMRIFRQESPAAWAGVIDAVRLAMQELLAPAPLPTPVINDAEQLLAMGDEARLKEQWEDAVQCFLNALDADPTSARAALCAGGSLLFLKRPEEARLLLERAVALEPDNVDAHVNLAMALLAAGNYRDGWREFEWRLRRITEPLPPLPWLPRLAAGTDLRDRTVLVHTEQGFGDTLQFVRYLPLLARLGAKVVASSPPALSDLLESVAGVWRVVPHGEPLPSADCQALLMSLPHLLQEIHPELPVAVPYLAPRADLVAQWEKSLASDGRLRAGLVWAGRNLQKSGYRRSLNAADYRPLADLPGLSLVSLQIGEQATGVTALGDQVIDLSARIGSFADTAAIIAGLDLVITIDTAVAHLAGAMGKPVWVGLLYAPDWRWLPECGTGTPWYPTMRLFRQEQAGEWGGVVRRMVEALVPQLTAHLAAEAMKRYQANDLTAAEHLFKELLSYLPHHADARFYLGTIALRSGRATEAETLFRALATEGPDADIYNNLGHALGSQGRIAEAVAAFLSATEHDPSHAGAWLNQGIYLQAQGRHHEAREALLRAVALAPEYAEAWQNLALVHQSLGAIDKATDAIDHALKLRPDYPTARWNLALLQLLSGNYGEGFDNFEARFSKAGALPQYHPDLPRWQGGEVAGRTLLVHAEQGFGDTIQFIRYLPLLAERGATVVVEVQTESLRELVQAVPGTASVIVRGEPRPPADLQIPMLSLPLAFGTTTENIPPAPYLTPPAARVATWRETVAAGEGLRIGLSWRGRPLPDPRRSVPITLLEPLFAMPGITWYSLQVDGEARRETPPVIRQDHLARLASFSDTAACIAALDLVITIDTAVAHLAGAVGAPAWVMLPFAPDWRWMLDRTDSVWYPSFRLFRQTDPGNWDSVVIQILNALRRLPKPHTASAQKDQ